MNSAFYESYAMENGRLSWENYKNKIARVIEEKARAEGAAVAAPAPPAP